MARGKSDDINQIVGQMSIADFSTDVTNYVVQSNVLISGKQDLKLNSMKILRAAIMQVDQDDSELKPYIIKISEIAQMLGVSRERVYQDIYEITEDITRHPIELKKIEGNKERWVIIPWVKKCVYSSDVGLLIKLNDELCPYLLNLQEYYARYSFDAIVGMKSVFAIRIFELLISKLPSTELPEDGEHIIMHVDEIREACGVQDKHLEFANFRMRVIDIAQRDINDYTDFNLSYTYIKKGRKVEYIDFHLISKKN